MRGDVLAPLDPDGRFVIPAYARLWGATVLAATGTTGMSKPGVARHELDGVE